MVKKDRSVIVNKTYLLKMLSSLYQKHLENQLTEKELLKTHKIQGFNVAAKWQRTRQGSSSKEGWFILTNLPDLPSAIKAYKKRFNIEQMFRDLKSGGYQLENTNVDGNRLISLILLSVLYRFFRSEFLFWRCLIGC